MLKEHYENMSLEHDQALYQSYQLAYQKHHKKEDFLASIILKAQMLGNYPEVELAASQEELDSSMTTFSLSWSGEILS